MKLSGFTFVRNAVKFDYPVVESITSILSIVDEFIVSVGNCDDGTLELIQSINSPKIKIHHSVWDDSLKEGGKVLAVETDKALTHVSPDSDWAFYLQADEVVHENELPNIVKAAEQYLADKNVEGLLFNYKHFYGTYDYLGDSRRWYDYEIRLIRNNKNIISYRDAQGFRTKENLPAGKAGQKLKVKLANTSIYHYGWVRHPDKQMEKLVTFSTYWGAEQYDHSTVKEEDRFDFFKDVDSVTIFTGTHPQTMQKRIAEKNWKIDLDTTKKKFSFKDKLLYKFEKLTGKRLFNYKNYKII
jgi:hypothetical protein